MGVIIQDALQLDTGLSVSNAYGTFGSAPLTTSVVPTGDGNVSYIASGVLSYYLNEEGYTTGNLQPLYRNQVQVPLSNAEVQQVYGIMYSGFATQTANVQVVD